MTGGPLAVQTERSFRVGADHPSLPGHFPGAPVVPGVLLIECVLAEFECWRGRRVRVESVVQVKFLNPLLPDETARASLSFDGGRTLSFRIARGATPIASGTLHLETASV